MKPMTYDFDVITDAPRIAQSPKRHMPDAAEQAPHADAEGEPPGQRYALPEDRLRQDAPPVQDERGKVRAAE
jgi:hypothetical protein